MKYSIYFQDFLVSTFFNSGKTNNCLRLSSSSDFSKVRGYFFLFHARINRYSKYPYSAEVHSRKFMSILSLVEMINSLAIWIESESVRQLITAHIDEDEFCRYVIQRDINGIALLCGKHTRTIFSCVPEDNPLKRNAGNCW